LAIRKVSSAKSGLAEGGCVYTRWRASYILFRAGAPRPNWAFFSRCVTHPAFASLVVEVLSRHAKAPINIRKVKPKPFHIQKGFPRDGDFSVITRSIGSLLTVFHVTAVLLLETRSKPLAFCLLHPRKRYCGKYSSNSSLQTCFVVSRQL